MRLDDCFKKRLLRRTKQDLLKSKKALEMASLKIERLAGLIPTGWKDMNRFMVWKHLGWTNMNQRMP